MQRSRRFAPIDDKPGAERRGAKPRTSIRTHGPPLFYPSPQRFTCCTTPLSSITIAAAMATTEGCTHDAAVMAKTKGCDGAVASLLAMAPVRLVPLCQHKKDVLCVFFRTRLRPSAVPVGVRCHCRIDQRGGRQLEGPEPSAVHPPVVPTNRSLLYARRQYRPSR